MEYFTSDKKIHALDELQENITHHFNWAFSLNRTLICGTPPSDDTLHENAHCRCKLGQWLSGNGKTLFGNHPRFDFIVQIHEEMHDHARNLAKTAINGVKISEQAYDQFLDCQTKLRETVETTRMELYNNIAQTDPLTGAETRRTMQDRLQERLAKAAAGSPNDWFVMMDLDHFKKVNDTYGHSMGDTVLAGVATKVRALIRNNDLFFRYGGEEFLLCISDVDQDEIVRIADRIRTAISKLDFKSARGGDFVITASFGVVGIRSGLSVSETIDLADSALYMAKKSGRNRVHVHQLQMIPSALASGQ